MGRIKEKILNNGIPRDNSCPKSIDNFLPKLSQKLGTNSKEILSREKFIEDTSRISSKAVLETFKNKNELETRYGKGKEAITNLPVDNFSQTPEKADEYSSKGTIDQNKLGTEKENKLGTEKNKLGTEKEEVFEKLGTKKERETQQKKLLIYIMKSVKQRDGYLTGKLIIKELADELGMKENSLNKALNILFKNKILIREKTKEGRNGWIILSVSKVVTSFTKIMFGNKKKLGTEKPQLVSSLSSSFTTRAEERAKKEQPWSTIKFDKLKPIGFHRGHLDQIIRMRKFTVQQIQKTIDDFYSDLFSGKVVIKTNALSFLMGILKRGNLYESKEKHVNP